MATAYEYGRTPEQGQGIMGLLDFFTPLRRPVISPGDTRYEEIDGAMYPVETIPGEYGDPEFGFSYMPAVQAVSGLLSDPVGAAKAVPGAMAGQIEDYATASLGALEGGYEGMITPEGEPIEASPILPIEYLLGGGIAAMRQPGVTLGAAGGKLTKAEKDPMGYSKTEMPYRIEDTPMEIIDGSGLLMPRRQIELERLQGKLLMPFFTDRSAIGGQVKSVDGIELTRPVYLEGGSGFMRGEAAQKQDALWASKQGIVSKMAKKAQRDSDKAGGADVVGVNVVMGIDAIDHSTMPTRIVARMLPNMDIPKEAKKSFNEAMEKIDENFPGVDADNLEEYLDAASGDLRKQFIRLMDKSDAKKAGFPNIGAVRRAVTDPELYDTPTFSEGVSFGLLDVNKPLIDNVLVPHSTYSGQMRAGAIPDQRGGYMGSLLGGGLAPQGTFFPQSYSTLSAQRDIRGNLLTPQNIKYTQERQLPTQMVDQQMLDALMENSLLGR
jgi:hypothetical protein